MNNVFRIDSSVNDMSTCLFKLNVFIEQAKHERNTVFCSLLRVFNTSGLRRDFGSEGNRIIRFRLSQCCVYINLQCTRIHVV